MAARTGQKLKLFHIIDILKNESDEEHPLNAKEICDHLANMGISAERKAIYDDIDCLIDYKFDIIKTRTPKSGYFLASRDFEIPEIYLLSDAVRTAKFISPNKTRDLVSRLDGMLSKYDRKKRDYGIYMNMQGKTSNEEIFYNIDTVSRAIEERHKIRFRYGRRQLSGERNLVTEYKVLKVTPYAMTWQEDHYYLIANNEKYDNLMHLRIDRMRNVEELPEKARPMSEVSDYTDVFDVADYTAKLFGMYGGETEKIELKCNRGIIEQIADRFGENIFIRNVTDTHFTFTANAALSDALVTFIMNYGSNIEVLSPAVLREKIKQKAKIICNMY